MSVKQINTGRLLKLFQDMVDIYSPSGKEEELTRYLAEYLEGSGLSVVLRSVDESRYNLEISAKRARPEILFLGHIDTVPAFDIEQYEFSEEHGICYGLGTADMKGGCAALIEAFLTAQEGSFLPKSVMLSLVVGEEENGDGTEALLEAYRFTYALVAEPTGNQPCISHYGYIEMVLNLLGYRKHAAMSDVETHAIRTMLRLLLKFEEHIDQSLHEIVLNIRDLNSSESGFAVPDRCSAALDLHVPPDVAVAEYAEELKAFFHDYLSQSAVTGYEIDLPFIASGYGIEEGDEFVSMIKEVYRSMKMAWSPEAFKSHSDANLLRDAGCTPVIIGPGLLSVAHTRDEQVELDQVVCAAQLYTNILKALHENQA